MKPQVSDFERGRRIVIALIALAVAFGLAALMFTKEGTTENMVLALASLACIIAVIAAAMRYCRCPHCGKRIVNGVLVLKVCPSCKRSLITGQKIKK
ncbi:MAG: hypothetical protein K6C12_12450 [Oscillospiraceae bacterium]|nr:hypothetical protein [Oscillospiraceae bacterium]